MVSYLQLSPVTGHLVPSERALCAQGVEAVDPEDEHRRGHWWGSGSAEFNVESFMYDGIRKVYERKPLIYGFRVS